METRSILIVDDEVNLVRSLGEMLAYVNPNYCVLVAHSGAEAMDMLCARPVDLLVTDLRMPGIDGLELIRQARASNAQTRAMLITAFGSPEAKDLTRNLGAVYLPKPFELWRFVAIVQHILDDEG